MPFDCVEFVEHFATYDSETDRYRATGTEHMIVWVPPDAEPGSCLRTISKIIFTDVAPWEKALIAGLPIYLPHAALPDAAQGIIALGSFNELLRRRDHSFVETPQTRQDIKRLRRDGYSETYRDYVVLRCDNPQYHLGTPIRRMLPTMRRKHNVRKHFRRFFRGVELEHPIKVRAHKRNISSTEELAPVYVVR